MDTAHAATDRQALADRLREIARQLRITDIEMITAAGSGHPGGTLSAADMIAALFFHKLRLRPTEPSWADRDRFILSKGHCIPIVYAAMAKAGFFPEEELKTLRKLGSALQGHPDRVRLPGIEASTGSLGQGLSIAVGMAMAGKMDQAAWRVFCMVGDGESQSGQIWEAAMFAGRHGLDNLCAILDYNQVQQTAKVAEILDEEPVVAKWRSFNWHVREIDGHDMDQILDALDEAELVNGRPTVIVSHTVKGKGVSWMELDPAWHGKAPKPEEAERALAELRAEGT
ncbi:MAG TPA: transketolase [Actinomycetota bacterium]|nr:transketolase [Actinomycetota bacterium]